MLQNLVDGATVLVGRGARRSTRASLTIHRHSLRFTLGVAQERSRPRRKGPLVFPIDRILLKGTASFTSVPLADRTRGKLLVSQGFEVVEISLVPRQTQLTGHLVQWLDLFTKDSTFFQGIDPEETEAIFKEVVDACEVDAKDMDDDRWMVMYVRLRVLAKNMT